MIHCCPNCPGKNNLTEYLYQIIPDNTEEEIHFQQWESTDRTTIVNMVMQKFEFIEFLPKKIDLLTAHSYIAKSQPKYLSILKENLLSSTCIVLPDFVKIILWCFRMQFKDGTGLSNNALYIQS